MTDLTCEPMSIVRREREAQEGRRALVSLGRLRRSRQPGWRREPGEAGLAVRIVRGASARASAALPAPIGGTWARVSGGAAMSGQVRLRFRLRDRLRFRQWNRLRFPALRAPLGVFPCTLADFCAARTGDISMSAGESSAPRPLTAAVAVGLLCWLSSPRCAGQ
jgi:hypothetical protein